MTMSSSSSSLQAPAPASRCLVAARARAVPLRRMQNVSVSRATKTPRERAVYARMRVRACEPRRRPRPPVSTRETNVRVVRGLWSVGILACRREREGRGRMPRRTRGTRESMARIWCGVLKVWDYMRRNGLVYVGFFFYLFFFFFFFSSAWENFMGKTYANVLRACYST